MTTRNRRQMQERAKSGAKKGALSMAGSLVGAGAGAALMYLFDPRSGRRRRAVARDKMRHSLHEVEDVADKAVRDARHRTKGAVAESKARLRREHVSDEVLHERVRAQLGRYCSHPRAIEVVCHDGDVELHGPCLTAEHENILQGIKRVRGVSRIIDMLELHAEPDISALQGGATRTGPRSEAMQQSWTPAVRLLGAASGLSLIGYGLLKRQLVGGLLSVVGVGLTARALANRPARELLGRGGHGIDIHKTVHIEAPLEEVFRFFERPENFPRFMAHVEDVHRVGDGGYHWAVEGPAGRRFSWDASFDAIPHERVTWRSIPGSTIDNEGTVRFDKDELGTRVSVTLSYRPPAGALGHAFARALGADPKRRMDDDLLRLKSLLEDGVVSGRFGKVKREDLNGTVGRTQLFGSASARAPQGRQ